MRIQTPRESRREIVGRISERLGIPARYEGAPGFAYTIGEITVERDGGIVSGNDALKRDPSMNRPRGRKMIQKPMAPTQVPSAWTSSRRCGIGR